MNKLLFTLFIVILQFSFAKANNVQITNLSVSASSVTFDISWENSWRSGLDYHDAVWVFFKQAPNGSAWTHANLDVASVGTGYQTVISSDNVGFFIRRAANGSGLSFTTVSATLDGLIGMFQDIKVFAIEMVYVPQGDFYAGDTVGDRCFSRGDDESIPLLITSEGALSYGSTSSDFKYKGEATGSDIPASYPKGYNASYTTKYLATQQQYVDFLNCLTRTQQENMVVEELISPMPEDTRDVMAVYSHYIHCDEIIPNGPVTFYVDRNGNDIGGEGNDGGSYSCNGLTPTMILSYLDWAGLSPHSNLEMEKACRGPLLPIPSEYSWGSTDYTTGNSVLYAGTDSMKYANSGIDAGIKTSHPARVGCNALSAGSTRTTAGATFYGAMDYGAHGAVIKMKYSATTSFDGAHGDGILSLEGYNNVINWPEIPSSSHHSIVLAYPQSGTIVNGVSLSANAYNYSTASGNIVGCRRL